MKYGSRLFFSFLALAAILLSSAIEAGAIPAFARRNKVSCMTCHQPFPKLKPYGEDFAGDGMIMKENEKARDYVTAGDDLLWLNRDFPVAVRFDAFGVLEDRKSESVKSDLQSPWGLKLLSGGALTKGIGYYFYFYMSERGEVAGIEDAYIHFDNVFDLNLDIMVGQFQTSDPLMKRELRLTYEDYMIYKLKVGQSRTDLTYDRGLMFIWGLDRTHTELIGLVVNGNGKGEAGQDKKFDDDKFKNWGMKISQDLGSFLNVGLFYYQGKEIVLGPQTLWPEQDNKITIWGPDLNFSAGPLDMTVQYLNRKDTNPWFNLANRSQDYEANGIIVETTLSPFLDRSRFYYTFLYNKIDHDDPMYDYETATFNISYLIARNIKLVGEYTRDLKLDSNRLTVGLVSGF